MGFDADMRKVTDRVKKWGETAVITNDDFAYVDGLVHRHYDERGRLFDDLASALKRDTDIQSPWDSLCDKGLDFLERLNSNISSKIPDGFRGLGLTDFYEGEKKAWQACKSGRIGLMAEVIYDIGKNDVEILRKLEDDLKQAREDSKICDELTRGAFGEISQQVKPALAEIAQVGAMVVTLKVQAIPKSLSSTIRKAISALIKGSPAIREIAKKKKVARDILLTNAALIEKAKEQLGDSSIRNIREKCEQNANSWKDLASSDFKSDWESFARSCCEVLRNKESPVIDKANNLFKVMGPNYLEAIKTSFVSMMSDPATISKYRDELDYDMQKMFQDLAKETDVMLALRASEPTKLAQQTMRELVAELQNALKDLKQAIGEEEERMKMPL
jgi:hypothetical protein